MVNEKGVPILLRAAQQLANLGYVFRLKLIGDGPVRADLERMVDELDLRERTIFTGFLEGEALREAMKDVTAAVMPSICQDVAPLASIELMLDGRLVIASDIGGLGELVDGAGLKFPPGDSNALADRLRQVLEHPGLARQLGNGACERARALFTYERMVKDHLQAYVQIVSAKPAHDNVSEANDIPGRYS
jgi:glycosyltransferase involved in cell wall biosynthesis